MSVDSVLITGCSAGGIGTGIALAFQKQGLHVFATAPSLSLLSHFSAFDNVTTLCLDVTSSASISAAVDAVRGTGDGKLKYLVNNAGLGLVMPILDTDVEKARKLFDVNFLGTLAITKAFVPLLIEGGEGGCVLNMGSGAGLVNVPWSGVYAASKAAVNLLSETLRIELEPLKIKVITVYGGFIASNMFSGVDFSLPQDSYYTSLKESLESQAKGSAIKGGNVMSVEEFGKQVVNDILNGKTGAIYRGTMAWPGRFVGMFPSLFLDAYARALGNINKFRR